jgi:hypothetical protein
VLFLSCNCFWLGTARSFSLSNITTHAFLLHGSRKEKLLLRTVHPLIASLMIEVTVCCSHSRVITDLLIAHFVPIVRLVGQAGQYLLDEEMEESHQLQMQGPCHLPLIL